MRETWIWELILYYENNLPVGYRDRETYRRWAEAILDYQLMMLGDYLSVDKL